MVYDRSRNDEPVPVVVEAHVQANATAELNRLIELATSAARHLRSRNHAVKRSTPSSAQTTAMSAGSSWALMSRYDDLKGMVNSASQQIRTLAARADERFAVATMAVAGVAGRNPERLGAD